MRAAAKLWRSDGARKSRFHTENGKLCLAPHEIAYSAATHFARIAFGYWPRVPWYTLGARRFLAARSWTGCLGFEFSCGMSTYWYGKRLQNVYAVEHDAAWAARAREICADIPGIEIYHCADEAAYVSAIDRPGIARFDLIAIDGVHRNACFFRAVDRLSPGGYLVLDNTDVPDRKPVVDALPEHFAQEDIHVFAGYPNSFCHANETTICVRR